METAKSERSIKIFYAWEDDLPRTFNRYAIKKALSVAGAEIEESFSTASGQPIKVVIDEATRDLPGSPHIPTAILEKIQSADVFVADVSAINSEQTDELKKTPNPNVVFELGYAIAYLGWERVLLLVNEIHGSVKALPFDFDRQRASPFKLADGGIGSRDELKKMLRSAISLILDKDPPRPRVGHFDRAQAQRERDLANLRRLLQSIHWPTIDDHIARGAKFLSLASTVFFEEVDSIVSSSSFHLYDEDLRKAVRPFVEDWRDTMKYDHYMDRRAAPGFIFVRSENPKVSDRQLRDWRYMDKARRRLRKSTDSLLSLIRAKFPEIDIPAISDATGNRYDAEMAEIDRRFDDEGTVEIRRGSAAKRSGTKRKNSKLNKNNQKTP